MAATGRRSGCLAAMASCGWPRELPGSPSDPDKWLAQYDGFADREPGDELKAQLTRSLLPVPPTRSIASGTVGVAYLRGLTLDPSYQLK